MPELQFASKKDAWLGGVFFVGVSGMLLWGVVLLLTPGPVALRAGAVAVASVIAGLLLWIWFGTSYTFGEGHLRVRCGPFRYRVELRDILEARATRSGMSGFLLSLDKVVLRTDSGNLYISPLRREEFLTELASRSGLFRAGDELYREGHRRE